jgi:hypothetical protein
MEALRQMTTLRLRRLTLGYPQWGLARASGVSIRKISFAERGLTGLLSLADRRRLAALLQSEMSALFPSEGAGRQPEAAGAIDGTATPVATELPVCVPREEVIAKGLRDPRPARAANIRRLHPTGERNDW